MVGAGIRSALRVAGSPTDQAAAGVRLGTGRKNKNKTTMAYASQIVTSNTVADGVMLIVPPTWCSKLVEAAKRPRRKGSPGGTQGEP